MTDPNPPRRRRTLLQALVGGAVLLLWPARALARRGTTIKLDRMPELKLVGGWTVTRIKGQEVLLIRDTKNSAHGLNPTCTHKQARLRYDPKSKKIVCPAHGCRFNLKGKPLKGPAKKPLYPVYPTWLDLAKQRILIHL